jgi:antitoxin component HigA of HigAB toxin-antitoxin module
MHKATMKTTTKTKGAKALPTTYGKLVAMHPPRVIHDAVEAGVVVDLIGRLSLVATPTRDQNDYRDLLMKLHADWMQRSPRKRLTPAEFIRAMMEEHKMTQAAMAQVMGISPGGMSLILAGVRNVSKASARRFAAWFGVSADAVI